MGYIVDVINLLVSCVIDIYIANRFMGAFFEKRIAKRRTIIIVYALQYVVIATERAWSRYAFVNVIVSLLYYGLITTCYEGTRRKKIIVVVITYLSGFFSEILVAIITNVKQIWALKPNDYELYQPLMVQGIMLVISVVVEKRLKNRKKDIEVPSTFTFAVVGQLIMMLILGMMLFQQQISRDFRTVFALTGMSSLLIIMYLYDSLTSIAEEQVKNKLIEQEKKYYSKQNELMNENSNEIRAIRHDIKNKMVVLSDLLSKSQIEEANNYLTEMVERLEDTQGYSETGNMVVDSILNYKLKQAYQQGNVINAQIVMPKELEIKGDDLISIIGNVLDNAMEATEKLKEDKWINVKMKYERKCVILKVQNSFDGYLEQEGDIIKTRKQDSELHGIGISNMKKIAEKYGGVFTIEKTDSVFTTTIVMNDAKQE